VANYQPNRSRQPRQKKVAKSLPRQAMMATENHHKQKTPAKQYRLQTRQTVTP
jgi:hypothetical protein